MARVEVHGATLADGVVETLKVKCHNLPAQTIDKNTAIAWMRDGHSFIPIVNGTELHALQLVDGEDGTPQFIRHDNIPGSTDSLPELPSAK